MEAETKPSLTVKEPTKIIEQRSPLGSKAPEMKNNNKESVPALSKAPVESTTLNTPTVEAAKAGFFKESAKISSSEAPNSTTRRSASPVMRIMSATDQAKSKSVSPAVVKPNVEEKKMSLANVGASLTVPIVTGSGKLVQTLLPPAGKARSSSPRPKPALTIDTKKAEEASTSMTILMPEGDGGFSGACFLPASWLRSHFTTTLALYALATFQK